MMTHELKTNLVPYAAIKAGTKKAEFRSFDRDFQVGDTLILLEYDPETKTLTGNKLFVTVTHLQIGYGIPETHCMMSVELDF